MKVQIPENIVVRGREILFHDKKHFGILVMRGKVKFEKLRGKYCCEREKNIVPSIFFGISIMKLKI